MKKSSQITAALLLLTAATMSANAKTTAYEFGFYSTSGEAYCDGIQCTASEGFATGQHIYDTTYCPYPPDFVAGIEGPSKSLGPGKWFDLAAAAASGGSLATDGTFIFFINVNDLRFVLAFESTDSDIPLQIINAGPLVAGPPQARAGLKAPGTAAQAALKR